MPSHLKGNVRLLGDRYQTRINLVSGPSGRKRLVLWLPTCRTSKEAEDRSLLLAEQARHLRKAGHIKTEAARILLEEVATAPGGKALTDALSAIAIYCSGKAAPMAEPFGVTFQQVAEEWLDGKLQKRFPDQVNKLTEDWEESSRKRLQKAVFPIIGPNKIQEITRADCDAVLRNLPIPQGREELERGTRRQYAGLLNRILNLAELAGYIDRNPLPRGWLPKPGPRKRFPILLPKEDGALLRCAKVPLCYRLLWGFLHREGVRRSEAAALVWGDLELKREHPTITLDENKTDHARWWHLSPGVAESLKAWRAMRGNPKADERVFTDEHGRPLSLDHMADLLRIHFKKAGLKRADLTSRAKLKQPFGVHSFRRSFVTRSLALGKNEDWVRQRTGHKSTEILKYRQEAKELAGPGVTELEELSHALPEFSPTNRQGRGRQTMGHAMGHKTKSEGGGTGRRASLRC